MKEDYNIKYLKLYEQLYTDLSFIKTHKVYQIQQKTTENHQE